MNVEYNNDIWVQERTFLHVSDLYADSTHVQVSVVGRNDISASYAVPSQVHPEMDIDVTDIVRMLDGGTFRVREYNGSVIVDEVVTAAWSVVGLINPASLIIPDTELADEAGGAPILPPSKILILPGIRVVAECYFAVPEDWSVTGATFDTSAKRGIVVEGDFAVENTENGVRNYKVEMVDKCIPYVAVVWQSVTGAQRVHLLHIVKQTVEESGAVELLTPDNSYNVLKGRRESLTVRIDDLSRYDLWYYGDIVTSSSVQVVDIKSFQQPILHKYTHNMDDRRVSDYYVISGGWFETAQGSITVDGVTIAQCLRFEIGAYITFNAEKSGVVKLYFNQLSDGTVVELVQGAVTVQGTVTNGYVRLTVPGSGFTIIRTVSIPATQYMPSLYYVAYEYYTYTEVIEEGKSYNAEVTDSKVEMPASDEGALASLEITFNYARYDVI